VKICSRLLTFSVTRFGNTLAQVTAANLSKTSKEITAEHVRQSQNDPAPISPRLKERTAGRSRRFRDPNSGRELGEGHRVIAFPLPVNFGGRSLRNLETDFDLRRFLVVGVCPLVKRL